MAEDQQMLVDAAVQTAATAQAAAEQAGMSANGLEAQVAALEAAAAAAAAATGTADGAADYAAGGRTAQAGAPEGSPVHEDAAMHALPPAPAPEVAIEEYQHVAAPELEADGLPRLMRADDLQQQQAAEGDQQHDWDNFMPHMPPNMADMPSGAAPAAVVLPGFCLGRAVCQMSFCEYSVCDRLCSVACCSEWGFWF